MKPITFKIESNENRYFHQLIEILKVFEPFNRLRKRQREVVAEIMYQYHIYNGDNKTKESLVSLLMSDHTTKEEIAKRVGITKGNLYNILKELRQLGILDKDGLDRKFRYRYMQFPEITFKFVEDGEEANKELQRAS